MDDKLKVTVGKTVEALARIERFIDKYGEKLDEESVARILKKVKELESTVTRLVPLPIY